MSFIKNSNICHIHSKNIYYMADTVLNAGTKDKNPWGEDYQTVMNATVGTGTRHLYNWQESYPFCLGMGRREYWKKLQVKIWHFREIFKIQERERGRWKSDSLQKIASRKRGMKKHGIVKELQSWVVWIGAWIMNWIIKANLYFIYFVYKSKEMYDVL